MMKKVKRNLSTPESREFWRRIEESAKEVVTWADWKRAGINVSAQKEDIMGTCYYLHDNKNKRNFQLLHNFDWRNYLLINHNFGKPIPIDKLREQLFAGIRVKLGDVSVAYNNDVIKLWAFCNVAEWDVEIRSDACDYEDEWVGEGHAERWQPHPTVCSLYHTKVDSDPCAEKQSNWEAEAIELAMPRNVWVSIPDYAPKKLKLGWSYDIDPDWDGKTK